MVNRLPNISNKHKICIICEGNEEYQYLLKLNYLKVWNDVYDVLLENAKGNGNIPARYQDKYQNGSYEVVLIFCDTEKKPYEQFEDIKRKINEFHGVDDASEEVVIFANPCTMQIIIKHWTDETLYSPAKTVNAPLIAKYTGVQNYKARADQINAMMDYITVENYVEMRQRIKNVNQDESAIGSSNFINLITRLEDPDYGWISKITEQLEGE